MKRKILFITRNYPPKVGGLETFSYNLIREFENHEITYKITLSKSIKHLVWFFPYAFLRALYLIQRYSIQSIHLCDGLRSATHRLQFLKILAYIPDNKERLISPPKYQT